MAKALDDEENNEQPKAKSPGKELIKQELMVLYKWLPIQKWEQNGEKHSESLDYVMVHENHKRRLKAPLKDLYQELLQAQSQYEMYSNKWLPTVQRKVLMVNLALKERNREQVPLPWETDTDLERWAHEKISHIERDSNR